MAPPKPLSVTELLGQELHGKVNNNVTSLVLQGTADIDKLVTVKTESALQGKYVGLYFSAHWCMPCRNFTPLLRKFYLYSMAKGRPFEIVFVSSDNSKSEAEDYFLHNMPWLMVPFADSARRNALSRRFGVIGIPTLVIISPEGEVECSNARAALIKDPEGARFPWRGEADSSVGTLWWLLLAVLALYLLHLYFFPASNKA